MAQNQKRRRRKRRGTQGGSVDARRRAARPRSREEAKARARSSRSSSSTRKEDLPPTWRNSIYRGVGAAIIFALLLLVVFKRPAGVAAAFGGFMLAFYIPTGYYIDLAMWRKRERKRIRERAERGQ
jgi:uncharacterized sodium:solute symporter family permease YidK